MDERITRRGMIAAALSASSVGLAENGSPGMGTRTAGEPGWLDARRDFAVRGDGSSDDTRALQSAIDAASGDVRPLALPPGTYRISEPLLIPPNTMLMGSSPALGFGCRIEPQGCPALRIGGSVPTFHCLIENLLIWPKGKAPDCIISVANAYSVTLRNVRIHDAQAELARAAICLLGPWDSGAYASSASITWENLIVRNDLGQPRVAILASRGCGSHRFIGADLENYAVLLDWRGGQLDLIAPYTERAGRFAVDCNLHAEDVTARLTTVGGDVNVAASGIGCAIRATTRNFSSFGTAWGAASARAVHVYALPEGDVSFLGIAANTSDGGSGRFTGCADWQSRVNTPRHPWRVVRPVAVRVPAGSTLKTQSALSGVVVGLMWARATVLGDAGPLTVTAHVSEPGMVQLSWTNPLASAVMLEGNVLIECGTA